MNSTPWTHHNLLRTLEDMYGLTHAGAAANVPAISGVFDGDATARQITYRQGVDGYYGVQDTQICEGAPAQSGAARTVLGVDAGIGTGQTRQSLIQFANLVGPYSDQVPAGSHIVSAKLTLTSFGGTPATFADPVCVHRMLEAWDDSVCWLSFGNGIAPDDATAAMAGFSLEPSEGGAPAVFDVTADVQNWVDGQANHGWAILPTMTRHWLFSSSESSKVLARPVLQISFVAP